MGDRISMRCPSCRGVQFMVEFADDAVLGKGPVQITCVGCASRWIGKLFLEKGFIAGPCCADGYEEDQDA